MQNEETTVRPYTIKQLAELYKVSTKTFRKWLKPLQPVLGNRTGHFYNLTQVKIIFGHIGAPFVAFAGVCFELFVRITETLFGDGRLYHAIIADEHEVHPSVRNGSQTEMAFSETDTDVDSDIFIPI